MSTPSKFNLLTNSVTCYLNDIIITVSPVKLSATQLQQLICDETLNCTELGLQLDLEYSMLKQLMSQYGQRRRLDECFADMCERFLNQTEGRTWEVVYKALESEVNKALMDQLKKTYPPNTRGIQVL